MWTLFGNRRPAHCDGVSRRDFLKVGALGLGAMSLPELLRAEARAGSRATGKSIINIYLPGGPTHMDMFDLKPEAPVEYRGEFRPIPTNAPGVEICELMPELATVADRFTIVRSISDLKNEHASRQSDSGWSETAMKSIGGAPSVGAVMNKVFGPAVPTAQGTAPMAVDLTGWTRPGYLGQINAPFRPEGTGRANLELNQSLTLDRLNDRRSLLGGLDRMKQDIDRTGMMAAVDSFSERAVGMVTSGEVAKALNTSLESKDSANRYGGESGRNLLLARRLVDVGVRFVGLTWGGWDSHANNFDSMRKQLPKLSQGLTALIQDLTASGRIDDTIIMMSGEFGRTPRINMSAGRDHWNRAGFFFLAGGGFRHGQVIGSTNARGEEPQDRPVRVQHVFTTVYHQLGINTETTQLFDPNGRPQYLLEHREMIKELI